MPTEEMLYVEGGRCCRYTPSSEQQQEKLSPTSTEQEEETQKHKSLVGFNILTVDATNRSIANKEETHLWVEVGDVALEDLLSACSRGQMLLLLLLLLL